uniref:Uncharacterized protein n=1 Tax=Kuetzingia canaliculata TaxID=228262 RepID=A0A1Z1MPU3_KUECA|nr:hypothetical protein [Kuetzingia canaliculata]ARW67956.1 hypothetical protein [Kuetzingia canaliculata]
MTLIVNINNSTTPHLTDLASLKNFKTVNVLIYFMQDTI